MPEDEEPLTILIKESFASNPCLSSVYVQAGKTPAYQDILQNFDGEFSVANLILSAGVDVTYPNANAITYDPSNYNIEIMFNPNELERPALDIARTLVHELIHAEMYRKLLSVTQKPEIPWTVDFIKSLRNDFPGLYDYYMRWAVEKPEGIDAASPQHQIMAQHYRDIIEQGLREFDNSYPSNIYENLVWVGLQNTVAWNNLGNDTLDIKQKVFNFFSNNPPCSD